MKNYFLILVVFFYSNLLPAQEVIKNNIDYLLYSNLLEEDISQKKKLEELQIIYGDPKQSKIIAKEGLFVVIYNPAPFSFKIKEKYANDYCNTNFKDKHISNFTKSFGKFVTYHTCEIINKVELFNIPIDAKTCIQK